MKSRILDDLGQLKPGQAISLPLFGKSCVEATEHPETRSANNVRIWWLSTQLGQTLAITSLKKVQASRKDNDLLTLDRAGQMIMEEGPRDRADAFQSTWNFIFVRDLPKALTLYHDLLGIPVRRIRDRTAVLTGNLVLEESDLREASDRQEALRAPAVIGVFVAPRALGSLHRRITDFGYEASEIGPGRHGERFRLEDDDGHVIEVCTSPPSQ
jgi:catechol 2,3-dioxygenase-like lactoylglutathione lyase family enzyme